MPDAAACSTAPSPVRPLRTFPPLSRIEDLGFLHQRCFGKTYPPFIDGECVQQLRQQWHTDEHDILICTAQKVGTHLAKRYVVELLRRLFDLPADHPLADGDIGHGAVPWPEVLISQQGEPGWQRFQQRSAAGPRLWYTHCALEDLPCSSVHPRTRVLVVVRDPRGVAVSQYHFWRRHPLLEVDAGLTLDRFVRLFVADDLYFGNYHQHVLSWLEPARLRLDSSQLCVLTYEDMVERKHQTVERLQAFLRPGHSLPAAEQEAVAAATDFQRMKDHIARQRGSFHFNPATFFRAGTVDSWRQDLSTTAVATIDAATRHHWGGGRGGSLLERYRQAAAA